MILQGLNISHLGKRKIIFKMPFLGDMLVPWRVILQVYQLGHDPNAILFFQVMVSWEIPSSALVGVPWHSASLNGKLRQDLGG